MALAIVQSSCLSLQQVRAELGSAVYYSAQKKQLCKHYVQFNWNIETVVSVYNKPELN